MKIPAIRAKMGNWTYYVSTLTFKQVNEYVSKIDDQLHKSESLNQLIQRSITNNLQSIKEYILNQPELFFNGLVLAVYDEYPNWREIEFKYDGEETFQMGLLEFPGTHKIFPVDGQHRVEGIKEALKERPELASQRITAIFIGHKNDSDGMKRTRRLFSTLNRYAKPVTMDDIIALDEDDSIAIATRELLESFELFTSDRVTKSKNKAIPDADKQSFTSIITLYQCNKELLKFFRKNRKKEEPDPVRDKKSFDEYLKFRPKEREVELFTDFCFQYWKIFADSFDSIKSFTQSHETQPALKFRNREFGGNLLFRPVGLLPLVQASVEINLRTGADFKNIFERFNSMELIISKIPWRNVVWNPNEKTMITGASGIVKLLLFYMYGNRVIRPGEMQNLKHRYADNIGSDNPENALKDIPID